MGTVFSFVPRSQIKDYKGDFNDFLKYLTSSQGVSADLYLQSIGAGTEPFQGSNAQFKTISYSLSSN